MNKRQRKKFEELGTMVCLKSRLKKMKLDIVRPRFGDVVVLEDPYHNIKTIASAASMRELMKKLFPNNESIIFQDFRLYVDPKKD